MTDESPLGRRTEYPDNYAPDALYAIPREKSRALLETAEPPFFHGEDVWNAWELTWLGPDGRPQVAAAEIRVPANSPNIVESKSLKLYLNSFSMSTFDSLRSVTSTVAADVGACVGRPVAVELVTPAESEGRQTDVLPGVLLDGMGVQCGAYDIDAGELTADPSSTVRESLHSHLLRSVCPVTAQPDTGSVLIEYAGPEIDHAGLLRYIVSFRRHEDFHEACVERIFTDITERCSPERLAVYARYQRRGGIDINPYRSSIAGSPVNLRLWRQ